MRCFSFRCFCNYTVCLFHWCKVYNIYCKKCPQQLFIWWWTISTNKCSIAMQTNLSLQLATKKIYCRLQLGCQTYGLKLRQLIRWSCWTTILWKIHKTHSWFFGRYINDCLGTASCTHVDLERCINYVNYFHPDLNFTWEISETVCRPWIFRY